MHSTEHLISGATQAPLLSPDQLRPGVYITGAAHQHMHVIAAVRGEEVEMRRLPLTATAMLICTTHNMRSLSTHISWCERCRTVLTRASELLPAAGTSIPRTVVLTLRGPIRPFAAGTVVAVRRTVGDSFRVARDAEDRGAPPRMEPNTPAVPLGREVWRLPAEVREWLTAARREEDGPQQFTVSINGGVMATPRQRAVITTAPIRPMRG